MSRILNPEAPPKATAIELDPEAAGWLLLQFHPQKGFLTHSGGEVPGDQLHFQLELLQQKILATTIMQEAQAAAREQAMRIQPARAVPKSPFG